jgi:ABC-type cobalt transport system substrate-binding protein
VIASFVGGIVAAVMGIQDVTYGTPVLIGTILILYFIGVYLGRKK